MSFASLLAGQVRRGSAFLLGTPAEAEALFGFPPPELPGGEEDGADRIAVENGPRLREAFARWLAVASWSLAPGAGAGMASAGSSDEGPERAYHDLLAETLRAVAAADRRQGLANLFWLVHSGEIAEEVVRNFAVAGKDPHGRYRIHPLLSGLLRRADASSRAASGRPQKTIQDFRRGETSDALVRSIMDDQLPLTETDFGLFDAGRVLVPGNGRFRIGAGAFAELLEILRGQIARGVAAKERRLCDAIRASCPVPLPGSGDPPGAWDRFIFAEPVREALLHDLEGTGALLLRSRTLRREISPERGWAELLEDFADLTRCIRRAEAVVALRASLELTTRSLDHQATRERFLAGRLFRFGLADAVQSGVRTATILFADIRGFTRASDGAISEGDLARELYEVFDPAALIVRRFGGVVDKYLGDGFMVTFGGGPHTGDEQLAAVHTAVVLQQVLGRLRRLGRTSFRMGISLHTGRVSVARFLCDERRSATTIIGRQVNIAGRLSASEGRLASEPQPPGARRVGDVAIDASGHLVNHGIAVSGQMLEALRARVSGEPFSENGVDGVRWYDHDLCLWLHFGYVGEARFRGLEAAVPVYSLVFAEPSLKADR